MIAPTNMLKISVLNLPDYCGDYTKMEVKKFSIAPIEVITPNRRRKKPWREA